MRESEYINATNYARLVAIERLVAELESSKVLPKASITSFATWLMRMRIKHSQAMHVEPDMEVTGA